MPASENDPSFWANLYQAPGRSEGLSVEPGEAVTYDESDLIAEIAPPEELEAEAQLDAAGLGSLVERLVRERIATLLESGQLLAATGSAVAGSATAAGATAAAGAAAGVGAAGRSTGSTSPKADLGGGAAPAKPPVPARGSAAAEAAPGGGSSSAMAPGTRPAAAGASRPAIDGSGQSAGHRASPVKTVSGPGGELEAPPEQEFEYVVEIEQQPKPPPAAARGATPPGAGAQTTPAAASSIRGPASGALPARTGAPRPPISQPVESPPPASIRGFDALNFTIDRGVDDLESDHGGPDDDEFEFGGDDEDEEVHELIDEDDDVHEVDDDGSVHEVEADEGVHEIEDDDEVEVVHEIEDGDEDRQETERGGASSEATARNATDALGPLWERVARLPGGQASLLRSSELTASAMQVLVMVDGATRLRGLRTLAPQVADAEFVQIIRTAMRAGLLSLD